MGPVRAAECGCIGGVSYDEGDVIEPPRDAAAVNIDRLKVKKIIIVDKNPCPFRKGFWDIDLKYVFEYRLSFREADGTVIGSIKAISIFNKRVTLFGSEDTDLVIATDLFRRSNGETTTLEADPFVLVEAKAVALDATLKFKRRRRCDSDEMDSCPDEVLVTIGLFTIIKIFRIVNLTVESRGFCIPEECEEICPLNPCEYFENLDFPMDIFAPPLRTDFTAGISNNIPKKKKDDDKPCGCD